MTLATVPFRNVSTLLQAMASTKILHFQIGANSGFEGSIEHGDDYFLELSYIATYDREETRRLQLLDHLERKQVAVLKGLFPEGVAVPEGCKTKAQLGRALLEAHTSDDDGIDALVRKLDLKQRLGDASPSWLLVYSPYKIRQAHDDALRDIQMRQWNMTIDSTNRIPGIDLSVVPPALREDLPKGWQAGDDLLVCGNGRSTACSYRKKVYRTYSVPGGTTTDAKVLEEAMRRMGIPLEDAPADWAEQVESITEAHRQHMTFEVVPEAMKVFGPPSIAVGDAHLACRGGCGFFGMGDAMLCSSCSVAS